MFLDRKREIMDTPSYYELIRESYHSIRSYVTHLDSERNVLFDTLLIDFYFSNKSKVSRLIQFINPFWTIGIWLGLIYVLKFSLPTVFISFERKGRLKGLSHRDSVHRSFQEKISLFVAKRLSYYCTNTYKWKFRIRSWTLTNLFVPLV